MILGPVAQEEICSKGRLPSHPSNKVGRVERQNQKALQIFEYQNKVTLLETCLVNLCFKAVIIKKYMNNSFVINCLLSECTLCNELEVEKAHV